MAETASFTGIVIKHQPIGDYDYVVTLFTREAGKIRAFARGARKMGSRLSGVTEPFCFGEFELYQGRDSYSIREAHISNFFEGFREDLETSLWGSYFLELVEYYGRENNEDVELLRLLYQSLRALFIPALDRRLVRAVFELRLFFTEGEFAPQVIPGDATRGCRYTVSYICETPVERLYTFSVTEEILGELETLNTRLRKSLLDRRLKSLELLERLAVTG